MPGAMWKLAVQEHKRADHYPTDEAQESLTIQGIRPIKVMTKLKHFTKPQLDEICTRNRFTKEERRKFINAVSDLRKAVDGKKNTTNNGQPTPNRAANCTRDALEAFKGAPLSGEELAQLQAQARAQAVAATKKASKPAAAAAEDDFSEEEEEEFAGDDEDEEEGDALFIQRGDKLHAAQLRTEYEELQGASKRLKIADGKRAGDSDGDGYGDEEEEEEERFDYFAAGSVVKCPCTAELVVVSRSEVLDCPACHSTLLPSGEAAVCAPLPQCFAAQPIECFECQAQLEAPLRTTVHAICPGCDSRLAPKAGSAVGPASMQLTQPAAEMIKPEVFEYAAEPEDAAQPMEDAPMGGQHEPEAAAAAGATPTDEDGMLLSNLFLYPQLCRDKRASGDLMVMLVSHEVDARHGKAQFYDDSKLHAAVEEREEQWRGIEFLLQTGQFEERFAAERRRCDERRDERDQGLTVPFPAVLGLDTHSHSEYRADYTTQVFQAEKLRFLDGRPAAEDTDEPPSTVLAPGAAAANGLGAAAAAAPQPPDDQSSALDSVHMAKAFDERDIPAEYLKTVGGQLDFLANTDSVQSHYEGFEEITREQQLQALAKAGEKMKNHGAQINLEPILSDLAQGKTVHLFNIPGRPVSWHGFTALCREINVEVYEHDRKKVIPTDTKTLQRVRVQQPGRVVESRDVFSTMNVRVEQREHEGQPTQDPSGQQDLYMYSFSPDKDKANNERGYDSRFIEGRQKVCLWSDCLSSPDESPVHPAQKALAPSDDARDAVAMDEVDEQQPQPAQDNHAAAADTKQVHTGAEDQAGRHGKLHHLIHHGHEEKPAPQASGELHGQEMPDESGWTAADQDTLLKEMQRQQGRPIDWDAIIKVLPHKTKKECALWLARMSEEQSSSDSSNTVLRAGGRVELMKNNNPALERIVLMTNSVHPTAVAYFAGNAQQQVQDAKAGSAGSVSQPLQQACRNALKQVQENAKVVVKQETERIEELVLEEAKLTVKKMELKIKHLKELHEMIAQEDRRREEEDRAYAEYNGLPAHGTYQPTQDAEGPAPRMRLVSVTPIQSAAGQASAERSRKLDICSI